MKALRKKTSTVTPKVKKTVQLKAKNKVAKKVDKKVKKEESQDAKPPKVQSTSKGSKLLKSKKKKKFTVPQNRGVVYISHIPHGFYEEEMRSYFGQFGVVTNVKMPRSKLGKSKGYAFIEFLHPEVAKVAAESMNNYLMMNRLLKTTYIPPEEQKPEYFKFKGTPQTKYERQSKAHIERLNKPLSPEKEQKRIARQMKKMKALHKKLAINDIDFDFQVNVSDAVLKKMKKLDPEEPQEATEEIKPEPVKQEKTKKAKKVKASPQKENPTPKKEEDKPKETKEKTKSQTFQRAAKRMSLKSKTKNSSSSPKETKAVSTAKSAKNKQMIKAKKEKAKNTRQPRKKLETEV